jgi:hypothetical protein
MITPTETLTFATVPLALLTGNMFGNVVANTAPVPDWASPILGSLGALAFAVLAVKWLIGRLDKQESKAEEREAILDAKETERSKERDVHLRTIAEMTIQNQAIITQNSEMLKETKMTIEKCTNCEIKLIAKGLIPPP